MNVAEVTLRFQGRFVYALSSTTKRITVMAPDFSGRFARHQPLMTIAASHLVFTNPNMPGLLTSLDPTYRVSVETEDLRRAETFVWDLAHRSVSYDVTEGVQLNSGVNESGEPVEVLDLGLLAKLTGQTATLRPDAAEQAMAVIEVTAGIGTAKLVFPNLTKSKFVTVADDASGPPDTPIKNAEAEDQETLVAEVVDFVVTLPGSLPFLTLTLTPPGGKAGTVTVKRGGTICFSHMCAALHPRQRNDVEFSRYYDLLDMPANADRLIPVEPPPPKALAEGMDCYAAAQIRI